MSSQRQEDWGTRLVEVVVPYLEEGKKFFLRCYEDLRWYQLHRILGWASATYTNWKIISEVYVDLDDEEFDRFRSRFRRIAVYAAAQDVWLVREIVTGVSVLAGMVAFFSIPLVYAAIVGVSISGIAHWALLYLASFVCFMSLLIVVALPADILSNLTSPYIGNLLLSSVSGGVLWWLAKDRPALTHAVRLLPGHKISVEFAHVALGSGAVALGILFLGDTVWRAIGESLAKYVAVLAIRPLPPSCIAIMCYFSLLRTLTMARGRWNTRRGRKYLLYVIRNRAGVLSRQIRRSMRALGGTARDRRLAETQAARIGFRFQTYEKALFEVLTPRDYDDFVHLVAADLTVLAKGEWPGPELDSQRSFRAAVTNLFRRLVTAGVLTLSGIALPHIPGVPSGNGQLKSIQAALIVAAVASLIVSDSSTTNMVFTAIKDSAKASAK